MRRTPLWSRAPWQLRHYPALALGCLAASFVLALTAASGPVFLSSAANGELAQEFGSACTYDPTRELSVRTAGGLSAQTVRNFAAFDRLSKRVEGLQPAVRSWVAQSSIQVAPVADPTRSEGNTLIFRDAQREHVQPVADAGGAGVWLTDSTAGRLRVRAGDQVTLSGNNSVTVRVAAVYHDLARRPPADFWCSLGTSIYQGSIFNEHVPPSVMLASDEATLYKLAAGVTGISFDQRYERPITLPVTVPHAQHAVEEIARFRAGVGQDTGLFSFRVESQPLAFAVTRARSAQHALNGPVTATADAGTLCGLLLMGVAGLLWGLRRRTEVTLLSAKGVAPRVIGAKAVLEATPALLLGAGLGWLAVLVAVPALGPSSLLNPGAAPAALGRAALALLAGMLVMAAAAAQSARQRTASRVGRLLRRLAAWIPWEVSLLVAAYLLLEQLKVAPRGRLQGGQLPGINATTMVFPVLLLVGAVALCVRVIGWLLPGLRAATTRSRAPLYLAVRRLTGTAKATLGLVATAAFSIGIVVYSTALTQTLAYTAHAKAEVFVGSDASAAVIGTPPLPAALHATGTVVRRIDATVAGRDLTVLAIDPTTFAQAAFWDHRFAGQSLASLMMALDHGRDTVKVPAIFVGNVPRGSSGRATLALTSAEGRHLDVAVTRVAAAYGFTGQRTKAMLVVDARTLRSSTFTAQTEMWTRGSAEHAREAIQSAQLPVRTFLSAADVAHAPEAVLITWAFGFLETFGGLAGLIALAGLLLHAQTRQRRNQVSYAFSRRMGLRPAAHLRSLLVESGIVMVAALAIGVGWAMLACAEIYRRLDTQPTVPPAPLLVIPVLTIVVVTVVALLASAGVAVLAQRAAHRSREAQLMRSGAD